MIRYAVMTETFEFNPTKHKTAEDAFFAYDDHNSKTIALFDSLDEARAELAKHTPKTYRFEYKLAQASVVYIEEADFDGDEFIEGSNIYDFTFEGLEEE